MIYISFGLFVIGYLCAVYVYAPFHWGGEAMMAWNAEHYGSKILFLLLTAGLAGCLYMICDSGKGKDCLCVLYSVLLSFAGAVSNYAQNIFQPPVTGKPAPEYVIHHAHAYINSIINVAYYQPYDDVCCSIYGHYGIMYLPFVKILGNDTVAVFRTIALFTFVCFLLICYITRNFVYNRLYYCILITAMLLKGFVGDSFYFQGMPHRFLFIFLIIAWEIFARKKKMTKRVLVIVEFILGTLAILWNLEMGFVAVVSLALFHITGNGRSLKAYIGLCVKQLIYTIGCFVTAYVFVNMYNILVGGGWNSLGTFLYPFGGKDAYSVEDLGLPMMGKYAPFLIYLSVFFCLFLVLGRSLIRRRERATRGEERIRELFLIDVTALCHMCYFINRPVIGGEYCCYYY
ncbi:MAG: hypothetical protein J6M27_10515, partial [Lachnospiraceae bacterium]|nr:hypothetical protein [Lachnospiraceae bacterium]